MSSVAEADADDICCCANCGIAEVDNIKLEDCDRCDLVKYCSDECQGEHREQHEEECKKREAELHDKKLFTQPDGNYRGDCPICFLPMPLGKGKSTFYSCCSEYTCRGCEYVQAIGSNGDRRCPFCREPPSSAEENKKRKMKRRKANDPAAMLQMGSDCYIEGDYDAAVEYYTKSAELGDPHAHYNLGCMYYEGKCVEKDYGMAIYHWEKAAIVGHPEARYNLGVIEEAMNGNVERSVKHFIIAANIGYEKSMKQLWTQYSAGNMTKEDLEATLRTHQAAIDATKSPEREAAEQSWK